MAAEDVLSKSNDNPKSQFDSRTRGSGSTVSGYIESPLQKSCGTCEYLVSADLCRHKRVRKDSDVPTDKHTGLKKIDPVNGCCSFWLPDIDRLEPMIDENAEEEERVEGNDKEDTDED